MSILSEIDLQEVLDVMDRTEEITILLPNHDPRIERGSIVKHKKSKYRVNDIIHGRSRIGLEVTQIDS